MTTPTRRPSEKYLYVAITSGERTGLAVGSLATFVLAGDRLSHWFDKGGWQGILLGLIVAAGYLTTSVWLARLWLRAHGGRLPRPTKSGVLFTVVVFAAFGLLMWGAS